MSSESRTARTIWALVNCPRGHPMTQSRRRFLTLVGAGALAAFLAPGSRAQPYPTRPVRIIVPYAAGGPNDVIARLLAARLADSWGQSIYVENLSAGAGNVGTAAAARAPADGYSAVVVTSSFWINPGLYAKLPYDPIRDFAPVTIVAAAPHVLVVHPSFPARDGREFVAAVRRHPAKYSYASAGTGQSSHLAGELFKLSTGIDLVHVPFNGAAPAMTSTIGGHTPTAFISLPAAASYIKSGQLRALAVTSVARSSAFPDVPTMAEAGFPNQESEFMQGVLLPAGVSQNLVDRWYREISRIVALPDVRERLAMLGFDAVANTPDAFSARIKSEIPRWANVIRQAHLKAVD
jgi:tripartite-type tricarboxylate transporter receptor subunit TctC